MLHIKYRFQSFEEYLSYDDGTDKLYELFNGELIEMPPESGINVEIATFLLIQFASLLDYRRVRGHGLELEVRGEPRNRYPDLTIIRQEHIQQLAKRNTIRLEMLPPLLVIEVVSPGELQRDRDFIAKRSQYQDCGIPEYWIIDPEAQTILILELIDKTYTEIGNFSGNDLVVSPQFTQLNLKVSQIFDAVNQA
ncbi:Endonuclease, Uma2 family (plasmid) [Nostoc flagelliforme CCNUN1]|uniref:Endonuclease, Uma2 family n=1 Tax=Nostoc flagelliforme CCNUN1 TaxID=2038116 RepID=A0A2K8T993_9NOSO|nr:Uma2 family endonuclease [Nostoc flagelliforme]AUB44268.1 Endonuclease, Uma2 family [Nostoc flagelliforme CCNUN1]AUB44799.1 Endonuclease, Uma2 family [Nostoc flagelliforme CCNUN1]